jgi:hypothetical protein
MQRRNTCLALALLFFTCGQVVAQATTADQNFKATPQQIKANAENKANAKANNVANSATDKLDSGVNKAFKGIGKMFKKKPKPAKDSLGTPGAPLAPRTDTTGAPKTGFRSGGKASLTGEAEWCDVMDAWAREGRKCKTVFLKTA